MRLLLALVIMLMIIGCTEDKPDPVEKEVADAITLTPAKLFEGQEAKYKPFLGSMSGSFKLKYEGNRKVSLDLEIWKHGQLADSSGSISDLFSTGTERESDEIELIISVDTLPNSDENAERLMTSVKVADVRPTGTGSYGFTIPRNKDLLAQGLITHGVPITFDSDEAAYVWGFETTSTNIISAKDFSPESLAEIEWGLMFKLRYES
jgi:hypothetical protein